MALDVLDTLAVVKRYVSDAGHRWATALCDPAAGHDLYLARATLVEVVATLCRKAREAAVTEAERDALIADFRRDTTAAYAVVPVTAATGTRAGDLCRTHRLRAYDAVQLAVALQVREHTLVAAASSRAHFRLRRYSSPQRRHRRGAGD